MYINRFLMLHQRLRRKQGWYKPTTVAATSNEAYLEVTRLYHPVLKLRDHHSHPLSFLAHRRSSAVDMSNFQQTQTGCLAQFTSGHNTAGTPAHLKMLHPRYAPVYWNRGCANV